MLLQRFGGRRSNCAAVLLAFALVLPSLASPVSAKPQRLPDGPASIEVANAAPDGTAVTVWTYRPAALPADAPIVIVMHGVKRNAADYRDNWQAAAEKYRLLVAVPEMTKHQFPGGRGYNQGNMFTRGHVPVPAQKWAWHTIEKVFGAVRAASGSKARTYDIFGHSAGAQFVHRFVLFAGQTHARLAISANAGWYTMPDFAERYPYGLADSAATEATLRAALQEHMVVLLGDADTDPGHKYLRHTARADAQGLNRFDRGRAFFRTAEAQAKRLGVPLGWRLQIVPGVGHDNAAMVDAAAKLIVSTPPSPSSSRAK